MPFEESTCKPAYTPMSQHSIDRLLPIQLCLILNMVCFSCLDNLSLSTYKVQLALCGCASCMLL